MPPPSLTRRTFLRAAGVSLALPVLESLQPCGGGEASPPVAVPTTSGAF